MVVGGNGKDVGKTSLICGLIRALPEFGWVAVKVTAHAYGAAEGIVEEQEAGSQSDTARYLAAGAKRAFLISAGDGEVAGLLAALREEIGAETAIIFESNRVVGLVEADACLAVVQDGRDAKPSFEVFLQKADAIVVGGESDACSEGVRPHLALRDMEQVSPSMTEWVREKLGANGEIAR